MLGLKSATPTVAPVDEGASTARHGLSYSTSIAQFVYRDPVHLRGSGVGMVYINSISPKTEGSCFPLPGEEFRAAVVALP